MLALTFWWCSQSAGYHRLELYSFEFFIQHVVSQNHINYPVTFSFLMGDFCSSTFIIRPCKVME